MATLEVDADEPVELSFRLEYKTAEVRRMKNPSAYTHFLLSGDPSPKGDSGPLDRSVCGTDNPIRVEADDESVSFRLEFSGAPNGKPAFPPGTEITLSGMYCAADGRPDGTEAPVRYDFGTVRIRGDNRPSVRDDSVVFALVGRPSVADDTVVFQLVGRPSVADDTVVFRAVARPSVDDNSIGFRAVSRPSIDDGSIIFKRRS